MTKNNILSQTRVKKAKLNHLLIVTSLILPLLLLIPMGSDNTLFMADFSPDILAQTKVQVPYVESTSTKAMPSAAQITSERSTINITIGNLILEGEGGPSGLRGLRILDEEGDKRLKMEVSYLANVTIRGGIHATDMGTMLSTTHPNGTVYSEGQGILTSAATGEMAMYNFQGLGQYGSDGTLRNHGSYFFKSSIPTGGELSFLNNMIGVYADRIDPSGKGIAKIWELK
jgi:hypothetical protein